MYVFFSKLYRIIDRNDQVIEWENHLTTYQQKSVISTFKTLLDQLENDSPETFNLLAVLSFLDAENIPLGMLTDGAQASLSFLDERPLENPQQESTKFARMTKWIHIRRHRTNIFDTTTPTDPSPQLRSV